MNRETDRMKLAYWANLIRESKTSGMKISEWCVSNQISIRKYYYWHKKVMHSTYTLAVENGYLPDIDNPRSSDELPAAPDFAELSVPHREAELDKNNDSVISIKRNGFAIEIGSDFSEEGLRRVLKVIQHV